MKKLLLSLALVLFSAFSYAQTTFDKQISEKSAKLKSVTTANECEALYNEFSAITTTNDPNRWKAYYFASLALYKKGEILLKEGNNGGLSETNAISYKYAMGALSSQPKNSDILSLIKSIEKQSKLINK